MFFPALKKVVTKLKLQFSRQFHFINPGNPTLYVMTAKACISYKFHLSSLLFTIIFTLSLTCQPANAQGSSEPDLSNILELINENRGQDRLCGNTHADAAEPLQWSSELKKAAQDHSDDMAEGEFMSHTGSNDSSLRSRVSKHSTRYSRLGENVAMGQRDAETVIKSWLESPGHCRNIMNPEFTDVAVAVKRSGGNGRLYWTMKLGTPHIGKPEEYVALELDKEEILLRLNSFRQETKICGEGNELPAANIPLHWYDGLESAALAHSQDMAENLFLGDRGTRSGMPRRRVAQHTESRLDLIRQSVTKGGSDAMEVLNEWLKDSSACRIAMFQAYTHVGLSAVQSTEDESVYYWTMKIAIGTPEYKISELREFFEGKDISVYGRNTCSLTRRMHDNLTSIGIDHSAYLFDGSRGPNFDKYMAAQRGKSNSYQGARGLPLVMVDNDAYFGFSTPAGLYQKMLVIEAGGPNMRAGQTFEVRDRTDDETQAGLAQATTRENHSSGRKTSLTAGYINDEFLFLTDQGNDRFYFDGESVGAMLSSNKAYLMVGYGVIDANEEEGEIRSISADMSFGGNVTLIRNIFRLPADLYLPIRMNLGYRNLSPTESDDSIQLVQAGLGAGAGGSFRIPIGIPVLSDGMSGFISFVKSVGGLGDLSGITVSQSNMGSEELLSGVRLMQNTDLNIEGRLERIFGSNTGITVGVTYRSQAWSEAPANNAWELIDVALGNRDDLVQRGSQLFFRAGINW